MSILKEFPAYAGMITSDSGGRTVIDKMFGTSRRGNVDPVWDSGTAYTAGQYVWFPDKNGDIYRALEDTSAGESPDTHSAKWDSVNAEWAGNDRPELHKNQACVEKEATNLTELSDLNPEDGISVDGEEISLNVGTDNKELRGGSNIFSTENGVRYIDIKPGHGVRFIGLSTSPFTTGAGNRITVTFDIEEKTITGIYEDGIELVNSGIEELGGGWMRLFIATTIDEEDGNTRRIAVGVYNDGTNRNAQWSAAGNEFFLVRHVQAEAGNYPTLPIAKSVTRPAPLVPIDNFLPDTGYVGWCGGMVRNDEDVYIFDVGWDNDFTMERSRLILSDGNNWNAYIYGRTDGQINVSNPYAWDMYDRKDLVILLSWSETNIYLWLCDIEGKLYGYTLEHVINDNTKRDVTIGAYQSGNTGHSSLRTANLQSDTDTIDTAEKAKAMIENLTRGSYNIKASEITHQNP